MRLWGLVVQIYALLSLPVEAVKSDVADMTMLDDPKVKNIVRAVRSSSSFTASPDELEDSHDDTTTGSEESTTDDFSRSMRGRDNFIRFGRGKNDNFMRFGRGKQDNFMRFGRSNGVEKEPVKESNEDDSFVRTAKGYKKSESERFERLTKNFIRLGRGKPDNFMRFGRGKQDNFMRFGRGKQDNFMRFGRGKQDNFMRFGRGKQDNFMRFGRGKQDNFMRFGRGKQDNFMRFGRGKQDNFMRFGRGKEANYMRFGRDMENFDLPSRKEIPDLNDLLHDTGGKFDNIESHFTVSSDKNIPIAMRSSLMGYNNFNRLVRSRPDNFLRFGKPDANQQSSQVQEFSEDLKHNPLFYTYSTTPTDDTFTRIMRSKLKGDVNLLRQGRHLPNKDDSFIRFGRNSEDSLSTGLVPQRLKRSTIELAEGQENMLASTLHEENRDHMLLPVFSLTDYRDEGLSSSDQLEDYNSIRKRSAKYQPPETSPTPHWMTTFDDNVSIKPLTDPSKNPNLFFKVLLLHLKPSSSCYDE